MNITNVIHQLEFNIAYAKQLVLDLTENQMTMTPTVGLENHPAFTLGHLITGSADLISDIGGICEIPPMWNELFLRTGPGDPAKPSLQTNQYPSKQELLDKRDELYEIVLKLLKNKPESEFKKPLTWRFSNFMPTFGDVVVFMCINHEAMHLGQLAAWRRAMGLESALAKVDHVMKPY